MAWKIPLFELKLGTEELHAVTRVLESNWLTLGEVTQQFENEFAQFVGSKYAFAVNNGTAALHLALVAAGVQAGDEVIVPALTFVATANAILYAGATPVFADVISRNDLTISPEHIRTLITPKTRAIMVMHYGGFPCHLEPILKIAREHQLMVIEDAAHAPGARLNGACCGTFGVCGCFSFFSNKNMTMGEGGMVTTNDDRIAERLRRLRSHGMTTLTLDRFRGHSYSYDVELLGYNYRPTEIQAAIGRIQLQKLPNFNENRKKLSKYYQQKLESVPGIQVPFKNHPGASCCHIFPIVLEPKIDRTEFMRFLKAAGIQSSIHYPPIHHFSYHQNLPASLRSELPVTEEIGKCEVTLPLYPDLTFEQIDYVTATMRQYLEKISAGV